VLVLRVASVPVGVGVGLWTAQLTTYQNPCSPEGVCLARLSALPTFATWQCILFGAGAAAFVLGPRPTDVRTSHGWGRCE
jgi:hypothetical protein